MPTLVVSTTLPKARLGNRLLIHFSMSVTATSKRGLMTPHLCGRRGWQRASAGGGAGGAREPLRSRGTGEGAQGAREDALVNAPQQCHDNLAAAVVVNNLERAEVLCGGARSGGGWEEGRSCCVLATEQQTRLQFLAARYAPAFCITSRKRTITLLDGRMRH